MRLIDADEVYGKRFTVVDVIEGVPVHRNVVKAFDVKEAPTIKAIPIEWIEEYCYENWVEYSSPHDAIRRMLEEWEKENEID